MGCWKETIYGGDTPLEWKENIYELCKIQEYGKNNKSKSIPVKNLTKNMSSILELVDAAEDTDERNIGYMVVGAICMHSGYYIDVNLKEKIIESIDKDEWSKENGVRRNVCKNFKKIIKEYDAKTKINIEKVDTFKDVDDDDDEEISKEFKEIFEIFKSRIKKIQSSIDEKSSIKEFDEGFETAAQEEIDFLTDFKELFNRYEMMGVLLERIKNGSISPGLEVSEGQKVEKVSSSESTDAGRADVAPG